MSAHRCFTRSAHGRWAALASWLVVSGCAHAAPSAAADPLAQRLAAPDARAAAAAVPDLFARAERAHRAALGADDEAAVADHRLRAQLWLDAAIAEHRRLELERAASAAEARTAAAESRRLELERVRRALVRERALQADAQRAHAELEAALQQVELDRSARKRSPDRDPAREQAAFVLRDRARMLLAAARALGLAPARADGLESTIARVADVKTPQTRLAQAAAVLHDAEAAWSEARAGSAAGATP